MLVLWTGLPRMQKPFSALNTQQYNQSLQLHIYRVEGIPYGSTCYLRAVFDFEKAREAKLEARRAARHAIARQDTEAPADPPAEPRADTSRIFRDEAGREYQYHRGHRVYLD